MHALGGGKRDVLKIVFIQIVLTFEVLRYTRGVDAKAEQGSHSHYSCEF